MNVRVLSILGIWLTLLAVGWPLQASTNGASPPPAPFTVKLLAIATVVPSPSYGLKSTAPETIRPIEPSGAAVVFAVFAGDAGTLKS